MDCVLLLCMSASDCQSRCSLDLSAGASTACTTSKQGCGRDANGMFNMYSIGIKTDLHMTTVK